MTEFRPLPSRAGSALALAAAVLAVALVATDPAQLRALGVAVAGLGAFAAGGRAWRRGALLGAPVALGGVAVLGVALRLAVGGPASAVARAEVVPGLVGCWLLAAALIPLRRGWERPLVTAGTGLAFVAVLASGVGRDAPTPALLAAGTLTVLAWDGAEHAVSVGGQVGAGARSAGADLAHAGASAAVGLVGVAFVLGVAGLGVREVPVGGLVALLVAAVVLALGLHR